MNKAEIQISKATQLGRVANQQGRKRVPAWDYSLMAMLEGRQINNIPKDEAPTVKIIEAWVAGYNETI